jgi:sialic acid synthase SpsE
MPYLGDLANGLREVGWSDHCVGIEICQQAIWHGARVIEKHVRLPHQAREGRAFEATVEDFKALRTFADADPQRFIGRWQHA